MKHITLIRFCVLIAAVTFCAFAQNSTISGTVSTQSGGPLANATVNLDNLTANSHQSTVTDSYGKYHFDALPTGSYRISLSTTQFTGTPSEEITLDANKAKTVNITVQTTGAAVSTMQVKVAEAVPSLDTTTPQVVNPHRTRDIQYLPQPNFLAQNGAAYGAYNLSLLNGGVTSNSGIGIAKGPVVGGQRPSSNNFYIEGVDNNNRALPGPLLYVPSDASTEFVAFQNQFPPEWGHAAGGEFNTLVRTGTNQFHGALYDYLQNRNLNAIDQRFVNQGIRDLPRYDQNRLGGNLGFPIIRNSLFFFGDFEYIPLGFNAIPLSPVYAPTAAGYATLSRLNGVSQTNLAVLQNALGSAPTQSRFTTVNGVQIPLGILPINAREYQDQFIGVGSIDWNLRNADALHLRYVHNETHANNNGAELPVFFQPLSDRSLLASVSEYHNFSPVVFNELRLGYTRFDQTLHSSNAVFPGLNVFPNISIQQDLNLQLGAGPLAATPAALNTYQLSDNVNWNLGRHVVKFGADARRFIGPLTFAQFGAGVYSFSNLNRFLLDLSPDISGQRSFGNLNYSGDHFDTYAYLNDSWQVASNFNVNLGVKYSYVSIPTTLQLQGFNSIADVPGLLRFREPNTQRANFGPLVGIAWSPGFIKNTVFRAGFGMNYDTTYNAANIPSVPPGFVSTQFVNTVALVPGFFGFGAIAFPTPVNVFTPSITAAQARAQTTTFIPDQKLPYTMQWNASIQQQVFHRLVVEARYLGVKAVHLPVETTLNQVSPVTATRNLPVFFTQPSQATLNGLTTTLGSLQTMVNQNNAFASAGFTNPISAIEPWGWSWYHGLSLQASQRFSAGLQGVVAYTWSHLIDNLSGPEFNRAGGFSFTDRRIDQGNSIYDHRHRVTATALWDLGGIGSHSFNWVRDVLANMTFGGTYTYETPASAFLTSGIDAGLANGGVSGVFVNSNGTPGVGSAVSPLRNSAGQVVGYLATNPNAQFIAAGAGTFPTGGRSMLQMRPINNFDATLYKRFAVRDRFSFEIHGDAYNVINHPQFTSGEINNIGINSLLASRNLLIPGTAAFGNIEAAFPSNARTLQVGVRLLF